MRLTAVGLSHHTAPLDLRERAAIPAARLPSVLEGLHRKVEEAVIVSTCNRTELYMLGNEEETPESLFGSLFSDETPPLRDHLFVLHAQDVAAHLFRVACGLDSLVLGEAEILGQIRRSWEAAHKAGTTGPVISRLFLSAVRTGKRARSETTIGRFPASAASAAALLARRVFGPALPECTALIIGAGEVGQGVARCLVDNGVRRLMVTNHRAERANELVARLEAFLVSWPVKPATLAQADVVVTCTAAPSMVLTAAEVAEAVVLRDGKPLQIIDLAVPRDVDPEAGNLPGVHLYNVDDLSMVLEESLAKRQETLPQVEAMVEEATARFSAWLAERAVSKTIRGLRERAKKTSMTETQWALARLSHLSERDRSVVEALAARLTNKLLHTPTVELRKAARQGRAEAHRAILNELFGLDGEERR
jgi:glutamyl-tRNA reductase